jgi:hypothetical protein
MAKVNMSMRRTFEAEQVFEKKVPGTALTVRGAAADGVIYIQLSRKGVKTTVTEASFVLTQKDLNNCLAVLKGNPNLQ